MTDLKALAQAAKGGAAVQDFGDLIRRENEYRAAASPDVILALLAIRDAAEATERAWATAQPNESSAPLVALRAALAAYALTEGATDE
jgi:hypothetical protein